MHHVEMRYGERPDPAIEKLKHDPWMKRFGDSVKAQEREFERRRHLYGNFGGMGLF